MDQAAQPSSFNQLNKTAGFLRAKANRHAWIGLWIALAALCLALGLSSYLQFDTLNIETLQAIQLNNPAIWLLDVMPFLFLTWGQHIGTVISYQAGAIIADETRELREKNSKLEYELEHTGAQRQLTDLPNQWIFASKLSRVIARRAQHGGRCAVLVVDTQQYHEVALAHGGDAARDFIDQVAHRLSAAMAEGSVIGHFGYDDFAVLIQNVENEAAVLAIASRIQAALDVPLQIRRVPMSLRSSIGIAIYPENGADAAMLIRHAETAKYAASSSALECLVYRPELENERSEIPRLVAELHATLDHEGLSADYVMQRALRDQQAPRLRMICSWPHPRRGRMQQDEFLNLPGRPSLTHSLTLWQLREACAQLAVARTGIHPDMMMTLRLGDSAYKAFALADTVTSLLRAHDLPNEALTLELRGSALEKDASALKQLQTLRNQGVGISLVGVGGPIASSAAVLYFPINEVQLVPELLTLARDQQPARHVLDSTVKMLEGLQISVTALGADNLELLALARIAGADYAEGAATKEPAVIIKAANDALA
jgi:diguanylate cyclase (GGDEF)-like protein